MTAEEKYNIIMSLDLEQDDNPIIEESNADILFDQYMTSDAAYKQHNELIDEGLAKTLLGADFLPDGKEYRLLQDLSGTYVTCNTKDGEKVFPLVEENELRKTHATFSPDIFVPHEVKPSIANVLLTICLITFPIITLIGIYLLLR